MIPDEKPLHVQVAIALGWSVEQHHARPDCGVCGSRLDHITDGAWWGCAPVMNIEQAEVEQVTRYDTDWAVTGPLIEKYGFWLRQLDTPEQPWDAFRNDDQTFPRGFGPTPLIAVCRLILALAEAGALAA